MSLNTISSKNLRYTQRNDIKLETYEKGNINIMLDLPKLKLPFGIENNYNKFELKFELDDNCKYVQPLIRKIEEDLAEKLDLNKEHLRSNIRESDKYKDLLIVKVPNYRNKFLAKIESKNENIYLPTFYDIQENMYASATIHIKKYWVLPEKYGLLIELKKLIIL